MEIYSQPSYYEIAFSFVDPQEQVDNFEKIIKKFSKIKANSFLDIACGPSLQLRELSRRGYETIGLDLYPEMLEYLREKAREEGLKIETVKADMYDFSLRKKVDCAFTMMGSLCPKSNEKFLSHLDSVAASLKPGGLYFIQNLSLNWTQSREQSWIMEKDGITIRTSFELHFKSIIDQIYTERLVMEVSDHGKTRKFVQEEDLKFIFPQEFKTLVKMNGKFEFVGWWKGNCNTWYLDQPLEQVEDVGDNMVLLRRRFRPVRP